MTNLSEDWYAESISAKALDSGMQKDAATCDVKSGPLSPALNVVVVQNEGSIADRINLLTNTIFGEPVVKKDAQSSAQHTFPYSEAEIVFCEKDAPRQAASSSATAASLTGSTGAASAAAANATSSITESTRVTWSPTPTRQDTQVTQNAQKTLDVLAYRDLFVFRIMKAWSALDAAAENPSVIKNYAIESNEEQTRQIHALREKISQINARIEYLNSAKAKLAEIDQQIIDTDKQIEKMMQTPPEKFLDNENDVSNRLLSASDTEVAAIEKSLDDLATRNKMQQEQLLRATAEYDQADEKYAQKKNDAKNRESSEPASGATKAKRAFTIASATIAFLLTVFSVFLVCTQSINDSNQTTFQITFSAAFVFCLIAIASIVTNRRAFEKKIDQDLDEAKRDFRHKKVEYEAAKKACEQSEKDVVMKLKVMGLAEANGDLSRAKQLLRESMATRGEYAKAAGGVSDIVGIMHKEQLQNVKNRESLLREVAEGTLWCVEAGAASGGAKDAAAGAGDVQGGVQGGVQDGVQGGVSAGTYDFNAEIEYLCERRAILDLCINLRKNLAGASYGVSVQDYTNKENINDVSVESYEEVFADYFQSRISLLRSADFVGKNVPVLFDNFMDCLGEQSVRQAAGLLGGLARSQQVIMFTCSERVAGLVAEENPVCTIISR